jgi:hypothetical protein
LRQHLLISATQRVNVSSEIVGATAGFLRRQHISLILFLFLIARLAEGPQWTRNILA